MTYITYKKTGKDYETTIDKDKLQLEIERVESMIKVKNEEMKELHKEFNQLQALRESLI